MAETYLKGLDDVMKNLNKEVQAIQGKTMKGLLKAAIVIRRDMAKTEPTIPIDTRNLEASWFVTPVPSLTKPILIAGFSAAYAEFVHENMEGKFQQPRPGATTKARQTGFRPGAGPKFYEKALNRNHAVIVQIIKDNIKID